MDKRRHGSSSIQLEPIRTTGLILAESLLPATQTSRQQPRKFSAWWGVYTYKHYPIYIMNFFTTIYFSHDFCNHCDISLLNNKTSKKSLDMSREIVNPLLLLLPNLVWNYRSIRILPQRELWLFVVTPTLGGSSWWVSTLTLNAIPMDGSWSPPRTTVHLRLVLVESLPSSTLLAKHPPTLNRVSIN